ncbi:lipase secretion chaperone [Acidovorax sp. M2(2025)]|uniref:lipase secretion chaperone n=1 Tax=Acidovorax sp. M2(2025) TaxID=3411355 RepID=UPI003BF5D5C6
MRQPAGPRPAARARWALAAGVLAAMGLAAWWLGRAPAPSGQDPATAAGARPALHAALPGTGAGGASPAGGAPAVAGTEARAAAADPFFTPDLRARLEALLLEAGDAATPEALKQRLEALAAKHFPPPLTARALALAQRYVDYRVALGALPGAGPDDPRALRRVLDARRGVRERHFAPEEYDALFAREDQLDHYTLARLEVLHNPDLSDAQKQRALKDAEETLLPPEQRAQRREATEHLVAAAQTQAFEQQGLDAYARHTARAAAYGNDAALALAQLDRDEQAWQQRVDQYAQARAEGRNPAQLGALRDQLFSPQEQLRLNAALALRTAAAR